MFMTTKRHREDMMLERQITAEARADARTKGRLAAELLAERNKALDQRDKSDAALAQIIALETPSCAHIGKKMAAVARDAVAT